MEGADVEDDGYDQEGEEDNEGMVEQVAIVKEGEQAAARAGWRRQRAEE